MDWKDYFVPLKNLRDPRLVALLLILALLVGLKVVEVFMEVMPFRATPSEVRDQTPHRYASIQSKRPESQRRPYDRRWNFFNTSWHAGDGEHRDIARPELLARQLKGEIQSKDPAALRIEALSERVLSTPENASRFNGVRFADVLMHEESAFGTTQPATVPSLDAILCELLLEPDLFDTSDPVASKRTWNASTLEGRPERLLARLADEHDALSVKERVYLNRSLLSARYPAFIARPGSPSAGKVTYGVFRRIDDPSFMTILLATLAGATLVSAEAKSGAPGGIPRSTRLRFLAWGLTSALGILTYIYTVYVQQGSFFWTGWGHPFAEEIRVVQFVEGLAVAACFPLIYRFVWAGYAAAERAPNGGVRTTVNTLLIRAAFVPILLGVLYSVLTAVFEALGIPFLPTPELGTLAALFWFGLWYLPFFVMLILAIWFV